MLEGILKDSELFFTAVDLECKLIGFTNAAFQRFLAFFEHELRIGESLLDALTIAGLHEIKEWWRRALAGESFTKQGTFELKDGTMESFQSSYFPLWCGGKIVGAGTISCRDPSLLLESQFKERTASLEYACEKLGKEAQERFQMQIALQESELMYRTLCDATNAVVWRCSTDGKFTSSNPSWENFTGQTTEESLGVGWIEANHPDDRERVSRLWKNVSNFATLRYYTRVWSARENDYRHMLVCASLLGGDLNKECVAAGVNIHELKETKKKLKKLTNRYHLALNAAGIGTWEWDIERGIFSADKRDWALIGVTSDFPQAFTLRQFTECIHPDDKEDIQRRLLHCSTTGAAYNAEFRVIWPDGSIHWLVGKAQRFFCKEGHPYVVGVMWDVTQNKMLEEQRLKSLRQEEEMKAAKQAEDYERRRAAEAEEHRHRQEEFIDTVCHEIRNPLVGIYGGINLLQDKLGEIQALLPEGNSKLTFLFEEAKEHLNTIGQCAEQQKVLVDDVLDLSRLESSLVDLEMVPFSLQGCMETVIQMFKAKMTQKGLELKKILPKEPVYLKGDIHRIRQVVINLLSNAVKFTDEGYIELAASVEDTSYSETTLCVSVRDTGIGISSELLPTIFDRFKQAKKSSSQYGGSGLGLAISKRLVEAMGGRILATSEAGAGATFFFTVKCSPVSATEMANLYSASDIISEIPQSGRSKRILVVDDNMMNRKVLGSYLEKGGHIYDVASNGAEAVNKCGQNKYDMIFMDIEMPVMNGLEATTILKQKNVGCPIVGLSGNARKEKIEVAFQAGMDEYLTKPYHKSDIERIVNSLGTEDTGSPSMRRAKKLRRE